MTRASQDALGALHEGLARQLLTRIADGSATAADLNVARQFLKDNGIEAIPTQSNEIGKLADKLPFLDDEDAGELRH